MTKWLGHWIQDQKVWGLIPAAGQVQKCRADFLFHAISAHPIVVGTWWSEICQIVVSAPVAENALNSPESR